MYTNRLADEKSPYLLQHAHNPVDWYPWGEAAFEKARREDKPIFLSVGYSTCHWCHVMEHESFESEETAEVLNRFFVPVKVDREERPDVDRIYMAFVQATTQSGGWPMSVWLTPDLKPFYGGTYFPPDGRYGRPGFKHVLEHIANAWLSDRARILQSGSDLLEELRRHTAIDSGASTWLDTGLLDNCFQVFRRTYDSNHGGFGHAPKFPRPVAFNFLLRYRGNPEALEMSLHTLRQMALGGMNDQLGGGFHRYSVDERWFVPHFEKMLYDQAQLAVSFIEAYQITGDADLAGTARATLEYVLRDMTSPEGGFFSAEDADSVIDPAEPNKKGEGAFYIWSQEEIDSALGEDARWFCETFGVKSRGNVDHDPHQEFTGRNILALAGPIPGSERLRFESARTRLLAARGKRVRPHLDDKVLTSWNGMMISAFALAGQVFDESRYRDAARRAADFVLERMHDASTNTLLRRYREGEAGIAGFLDDYAFFGIALADVYETCFDRRYLRAAERMLEAMIAKFEDGERGGFFSSPAGDPNLVLRLKDEYDGAEPAGNSIAATALVKLSSLTGRSDFLEAAERTFRLFAPRLRTAPHATPQMAVAYTYTQSPPKQIVLAGETNSAAFQALLKECWRTFLPGRTLLHLSEDTWLTQPLPALAGIARGDGPATAYVCEKLTCQLPVSRVEELQELLK
jgi:uncharacterized protein YyaL (SSP411 family)